MFQIHYPLLLGCLALAGLQLGACQSDKHTMVEPKGEGDGTVIVCKLCYDEVYRESYPSGSRWGGTIEQTHQVHQCPSCKTDMSTYVENAVPMIKCAGCAPDGVACDKCLPPKGYTGPKLRDHSYAK